MFISLNDFICPHCLKENTAIEYSGYCHRKISQNVSVVFCCKSCDKNIIFDFDKKASDSFLDYHLTKGSFILRVYNSYIWINDKMIGRLDDYYPKPKEITLPDHLPVRVGKTFKDAKELFIQGYYNPSAMSSRRAIDLATKELIPDHDGMLNSRIKLLLDKNIITKQLYDWANIIRLDGNSANHDDIDFTKNETEALLNFSELFLMYAFSLPKMVEIKQNEIASN